MRFRLLAPMVCLGLLVALVYSLLPGPDSEALAASKQVTDAVTVIKSDVGWGQRLRAFEILKREGSSDAIAELVKLTGHQDVRVSATACTALARMKSDASKGKLKDLIADTSEDAGLRRAAMNALARHGTSSDRAWIETKAKSDPDLATQFSVLESMKLWK